jgi:3-dehydroquinate dehydratase
MSQSTPPPIAAVLKSPNEGMFDFGEPYLYAYRMFDSITRVSTPMADRCGFAIDICQANCEVERLDEVREHGGRARRMPIIPIVDATTSVPLVSTLPATELTVIERHAPNRRRSGYPCRFSSVSPVTVGVFSGLGMHGYTRALTAKAEILHEANA